MTLITDLTAAGLTVAAAESLTGGAVCTELSREPGSSRVFLAGVVSYSLTAKERILGVDPALLSRMGPVHPDVACAMALGVARLVGADIGVSTTGVAGPEPHGGREPGDAFVGWWTEGRSGAVPVRIPGDRRAVVSGVTAIAVAVLGQLATAGVPDPRTLGPGVVADS